MWKGAFFVHFLPAINSILLPNSNRMLHFPFSFSFSSFFYFFSPLTCPVRLYLLEIQSCFLRLATRYLHGRRSNLQWMIDLPIFRAKSLGKDWKMPLFRKEYIWYNSKSMNWYFMLWFGMYRFSMGCKLHWHKKNILFGQNVNKTKIKKNWVFVQNLMLREEKKTFSFGHCPNEGGGSTHARIFWPSFKKCIFVQ